MVGYIHLWRRLLKKPIWLKSTPEQRSVLIAILLMANFYENEWEWKGEKFQVVPGQFITSLESIRKKSGQGISIQNVRSSLKRFEKLEFLTNKSTKQGRLISIINWEDYQSSENNTQHSTQQRPNKGATKTQHLSNNDKKDKNERIKDIVFFLNQKANTNFKPTTNKTRSLINARLNENFTLPDFKFVITKKCSDWIGTDMEKYLRPETLFGTKFESYLNEKQGKAGVLKPTTYAQAQDLERRTMVKILKDMENEDNKTGNSQRVDQASHLLSHGKKID